MENLVLILNKYKDESLTENEAVSLLKELFIRINNQSRLNEVLKQTPYTACGNKQCFCDGSCYKKLADWTYRPEILPYYNSTITFSTNIKDE